MPHYQNLTSSLLQAYSSLDYRQGLALLASTQLAGALYLHALNRKGISPGWARFIASLPVLAANLAAPLLFNRDSDATTIVLIAFNTAWLSSFKILLWTINRSALASKELDVFQFTAMLLAPLTPVSESRPARGGAVVGGSAAVAGGGGRLGEAAAPRRMLLDGILKLATLGILARMLLHAEKFHPYLRAFLYGIALYAILSSIMDGPGALFSSWLGVPVSPHFDEPWFSSSVVSFWSRRWDLAAGNVLRQLIYDPIVEKTLIGVPATSSSLSASASALKKLEEEEEEKVSKGAETTIPAVKKVLQEQPQHSSSSGSAQLKLQWRRVLGSSAAFLTSGLVHECIFWYLTGHTSGGVWLSFFTIQIPVVILERTVLHFLKSKGIYLPLPLMVCWTVAFECVTTAHLFWGPAERAGLVKKVISNVDVAYSQYAHVVDVMVRQSHIGRHVRLNSPVWLRTATHKVLSAL